MKEIGIRLQVWFGEEGEMQEVFYQKIGMDGDKHRVESVVRSLREVVGSVMSTYLRSTASKYKLDLSDKRREIT